MIDLVPLYLSAKLALVTTAILLVIGAALAYPLAMSRFAGKSLCEAFINLPLVLPPTVLGFFLLMLMGPRAVLGRAWQALFGSGLLFTFTALVMASIIYSLPFAVQPMKTAFTRIDKRLIENAYVLGLSPLKTFFRVILPNSLGGVAAGAILVFLHTLGEFGVILMVGGSMPGETKVASIAIYEAVEALRYQDAWILSALLIPTSYIFLLVSYRVFRSE
ncbi:MAG: molybdate ABC transporter permease subunit [Syntrophaceae bacterium]